MIITAAPVATLAARLLQQGGYTWGYINGDDSSPLTCPEGYPVTYATESPNFLGCCNQVSCAHPAYITCTPYGAATCGPSCLFTELDCSSSAPSCVTYYLQSAINDISPATTYACAEEEATLTVLSTATGDSSAAPSTSLSSGPTTTTDAGSTSTTGSNGSNPETSASPSSSSGAGSGGGSDSNSGGGGPSGLSQSEKIDLGVGIGVGVGIGLPGSIAACIVIYKACRGRSSETT